MLTRHCLILDLKNDPDLIEQYDKWHRAVWPEIIQSIKSSGIDSMEIYRFKNRLFMIIEAKPEFDFAVKAKMDANDPKVQEWEKLMWNYQQSVPGSAKGEKWVLMENIFKLEDFG